MGWRGERKKGVRERVSEGGEGLREEGIEGVSE